MSSTNKSSSSGDIDLNTIPYDAPLSFELPTKKWCDAQSMKGATWWTTLAPTYVPGKDLSGQWVIITGGNNGIGKEAALQFATWGANLILACRDPPPHETHPNAVIAECRELANAAGHEKSQLEWWTVNFADLSSVEAFASRWLETKRPLSILCNNAGMGSTPNPVPFKTKDGFEMIHQVNFLSHVLLTLRLLPSLAQAEEPRIVCSTSCYHYVGTFDISNFNGKPGDPDGANLQYYQNNKLYFQIWLTELQHRLLEHEQYRKITINGYHPGYVNSGIWTLAMAKESWWAWAIQCVLKTMAYFIAITPQQGSLGMLYVATSPECGPDPSKQGIGEIGGKGGGRYFNRVWEDESHPCCRDRDCRMRVWRKVNDELKLEEKGLLDVVGLYVKG